MKVMPGLKDRVRSRWPYGTKFDWDNVRHRKFGGNRESFRHNLRFCIALRRNEMTDA